ncbi:MAG: GC-type dockerin domain-anchored protein [Planctomycetota bacterium]
MPGVTHTSRWSVRLGAVVLAAPALVAGPAHAERLLGISHSEQMIFKLDTETGELIKFFGHPILWLGGLDIDSQGNLYYLGSNTLYRIDLGQPANDVFVGSNPGLIFESFEILDDGGYSGDVFNGLFYTIDLATGMAVPVGPYGHGGVDRITGLASTDYPGSIEPTHLYGGRVFLQDIIEIDHVTGENLGVVVSDPALNTTNLAYGPSGFWFIDGQRTLYLISLAAGSAVPVLEDLDIAGVDGLTVVHPEPSIATESLPNGVVDVPYGPVTLEASGGGPGLQWVALSAGYEEIDLGENQWEFVGQAQGLSGDDVAMAYALPFAFPYYGESYIQLWICNNGFLDFDGPFTDPDNNDEALIAAKRICPLWDDLRTDFGNRDVHIDESVPGEVTIRWDTLQFPTFGVCNFSCTLEESGAIEFHYGVPNTDLSPTVGISAGDGQQFILGLYNGQSNLDGVNSLRYQPGGGLPEGLVLSSNGVLAGTPLETGTFTATFRLTDSLGGFDEREFSFDILETCPPDVSGPVPGQPDGVVDVLDFLFVLANWGTSGPGDFTGPEGTPDGIVDILEFLAILAAWGPC